MHKLKRNIFIIGLTVAGLTIGLAAFTSSFPYLSEINAGNTNASYHLDISSKDIAVSGSYGSGTLTYSRTNKDPITFSYSNAMGSKGNIAQMKAGSHFHNTSAITNITKIKLTFDKSKSSGKILVATGNTVNPKGGKEIASGQTLIFNGTNDYYFSIVPNDTVLYLKTIHIEYSCSKYITGDLDPNPDTQPETDSSSSLTSSSSETINDKDTLTLTGGQTNLPTSGYSNGTFSATSLKSETINLSFTEAYQNGNVIQMGKNTGEIHNITPLNGLSEIKINVKTNTTNICYGNRQNPTSNQTSVSGNKTIVVNGDNPYFSLSATGSYTQINSIVFTFKDTISSGGEQVNPDPNPDIPGPDSSSSEGNPNPGTGEEGCETTPQSYEKPTQPLTGYYQNFPISGTPTQLLSNAREYTVSKHKTYTSYDECTGPKSKNIGKYGLTDPHPDYPGKLLDFYTHAPIDDIWDANTNYNREHVWPQSLSGNAINGMIDKDGPRNWGKTGGGSDLHHVRPNFSKVNGKRSNMKFGETSGGVFSYVPPNSNKSYDAGYTDGTIWEPMDFAKGDVARIVLYCFIHYNTPSNLETYDNLTGTITSTAHSASCEYPLPIRAIMGTNTDAQAFKMLINWHTLDKVDSTELTRNNAVAKIQGNRNPFIDQPWLVESIWGNI